MSLDTRLFISNLPENIKDQDLRNAFSSYGQITNVDIKSKPGVETEKKVFAFITIAATNYDVESCIKHFSNENFHGNRLYITRARESFLERLQRERAQAQQNDHNKVNNIVQQNYVEHKSLDMTPPAPHKRKFIDSDMTHSNDFNYRKTPTLKDNCNDSTYSNDRNYRKTPKIMDNYKPSKTPTFNADISDQNNKTDSDKKRIESMKKKRQEFNQKKMIIKTGLTGVDKVPNKKVIFSDNEDEQSATKLNINNDVKGKTNETQIRNKAVLFDEGESDDDNVNFEIKMQYEGKKGQKVLDLQSRYKSDKRFTLDQRFIDEEHSDDDKQNADIEEVHLSQIDEKSKQLNILQDVLGVTIKTRNQGSTNKTKSKLGMLRFDPTHPEHAKFLAPVEKKEPQNKSKKKRSKDSNEQAEEKAEPVVAKVEASKEQFYKVSETLKEAIAQPNTFSLRSLFSRSEDVHEESLQDKGVEVSVNEIKSTKDRKLKNPLDPGEKNPFVYDSSDSEPEEESKTEQNHEPHSSMETETVWREKLFFTKSDSRLKEGLNFFCKPIANESQKERRELKSVMKKRIYNKDRKNQMFQKKIGGRKKTMKKSFRNKN